MARSFGAELQKARRRWDLTVALGIPLIVFLWASRATPGGENLASGYAGMFYSLPLMNAVIMPVGMAALASRIWDCETKGSACKLLYTLQTRQSLFAAKALLGLLENLLVCAVECGSLLALGRMQGYTETLLPGRLGWLFLCTFLVNAMLCFFSFWLSMRFANQVVALAVGFCGALIGLFAAFMPVVFSYFIPFGYYIPLGAVGMDWNPETRVAAYFYADYPWWLLGVTALLAAALAALCLHTVKDKEV